MRDKNYSHVDPDFKYENKISYEYLIETIIFIEDYLSLLATNIMKLNKLEIFDSEPVGIIKK